MVKKITGGVLQGILAGICIALGGSVYLACDNKYIGSLLFCIALVTICYNGFSLYTGKIGLVIEKHSRDDLIVLFTGFFGNILSCVAFGQLLKAGLPSLYETAQKICEAKLTQTTAQTFIRGIMCGILMYIAVWVYANKKNVLGIFLCIPVFVLSGFEHSIADMFYFAIGNVFTAKGLLFIFVVVLGNTVGSILFAAVYKLKDLCLEEK